MAQREVLLPCGLHSRSLDSNHNWKRIGLDEGQRTLENLGNGLFWGRVQHKLTKERKEIGHFESLRYYSQSLTKASLS